MPALLLPHPTLLAQAPLHHPLLLHLSSQAPHPLLLLGAGWKACQGLQAGV